MNTHKENIITAVVDVVKTTLTAGSATYRSRVLAMKRDQLPAIIVKPGAESVERMSMGIEKRVFSIIIQIHARSEIPDQLTDSIAAEIHAALMADQSLGGKIKYLVDQGSQEPEFSDADEVECMQRIEYAAQYFTSPTDNTTAIQ